MKQRRCGERREDLSAYVDDELDAEARARLEGHLRDCELCRRELTRLRKLVRMVSSVPLEEPPAGLRERIRARVRRERRPRRFVPQIPWWLASSAVAAGLAGAVALIGVLRVPPGRAPMEAKARRAAPVVARPRAAAEAEPAAARDADFADQVAPTARRKAMKARAYEAKKNALPPAPPARAPETVLRKDRARRAEELLRVPAEMPRAVMGGGRAPAAGDKESAERPVRDGHMAFVSPGANQAAARPPRPSRAEKAKEAGAPRTGALAKAEAARAPGAFARGASVPAPVRRAAERAEADEAAAGLLREVGGKARYLAGKEQEKLTRTREEGLARPPGEPGAAPGAERVVALAADSFEKALSLVEKAAGESGGRLERKDSAAGELVCLIPASAVEGFARAISPPAARPGAEGVRRARAEKRALDADALRRKQLLAAAQEEEKQADEAGRKRLVRVVVRVTIERP